MSCIHRLNNYGLVSESTRGKGSSRQVMLATSIRPILTREQLLSGKGMDPPLCKHRKGFLDHLKPRAFIMSTVRVAIQQSSLIVANFMSDQLEMELKRNKSVQEGKISQGEADEQAQEWEKVEWEKRWKVFPNRFFTAFAKYHVITLLMRTYEYLASLRYDKLVLDKLTMDPFYASRQFAISKKSNRSSSSSENTSIAKEMFYTTFWGNLIAFMADYSVHQVVLCYGYYVYIRRKRQEASSTTKHAGDEPVVVVDAVIMTSLLRKSTQLFVSRAFGLFCSAVGGAVGTLWWPGWGTILLSNMGEGAAAVVMDDGLASTHRHQEGE